MGWAPHGAEGDQVRTRQRRHFLLQHVVSLSDAWLEDAMEGEKLPEDTETSRSTKPVIGYEEENITSGNSKITLLSYRGLSQLYQRGNDPAD